ncbi:TetR/AcrR family transcriptional regulator [bacterium]|nr:MAG: TetR/AcrR family transcriptional regulator [bacterium]
MEDEKKGLTEDRAVRADARRNLESLLQAAKTVFAESGVDAPVRGIAERAGVGLGTMYRHFPRRADLIAAVFRRELDACADLAPILAAEHRPGEALEKWVDRYLDFIATKRGLATALHSGDPAYDALPAYFEEKLVPAFRPLLESAAASGEIRPGVSAEEILYAIASLCAYGDRQGPEYPRRMVALLLNGLRFGAVTTE